VGADGPGHGLNADLDRCSPAGGESDQRAYFGLIAVRRLRRIRSREFLPDRSPDSAQYHGRQQSLSDGVPATGGRVRWLAKLRPGQMAWQTMSISILGDVACTGAVVPCSIARAIAQRRPRAAGDVQDRAVWPSQPRTRAGGSAAADRIPRRHAGRGFGSAKPPAGGEFIDSNREIANGSADTHCADRSLSHFSRGLSSAPLAVSRIWQ
jgi:hypothetical protein